ncbi:hypothetical protein EZV62_005635 [Acer yangbiense]|uniref:Uncharacterized protein n=1 Tax=Acer yangbiense TaxID=1000413 RepID=A0A5C7IN97_9ROSI|nr:hypothetical protein EZV62_005635 [Acer yangbiense]
MRLEKIQEDIGKKIGLCDEQWKNKNPNEKTQAILKVLSQKEIVCEIVKEKENVLVRARSTLHEYVKMHDEICGMTLWIVSEIEKEKENVLIRASLGLT